MQAGVFRYFSIFFVHSDFSKNIAPACIDLFYMQDKNFLTHNIRLTSKNLSVTFIIKKNMFIYI